MIINPIDNIYAKAKRISGLLGIPTGIDKFATTEFSEEERNQSDLHRLFYDNDGPIVHKWKHYLSIYDHHLSRFQNRPLRLLEIGVFKGGSLLLWRKYLGSKAIIFGIDIDDACSVFDGQHAQVRIGSQDDPAFLDRVVEEMGGLDVVIDDGSHVSSDQIASFRYLFPKLNENGVYLCEDLHTNYWRGWHGGGYRRRSTFIEMSKRLVDAMHSDFHSHRGEGIDDVAAIHFYNSVAVIDKCRQTRPAHIKIGSR